MKMQQVIICVERYVDGQWKSADNWVRHSDPVIRLTRSIPRERNLGRFVTNTFTMRVLFGIVERPIHEQIEPIGTTKGLPGDVSADVAMYYLESCGREVSWLGLTELVGYRWQDVPGGRRFHREAISRLKMTGRNRYGKRGVRWILWLGE